MIKKSGTLSAVWFTAILSMVGFVISTTGFSQFAPPAGQAGTTAVYKDSSAIVRWANGVQEFVRGASDIANGWGTLASFGVEAEALGYAQGNSTDVVSLGDSGYVTLSFPFPIKNGPGNDFAVFENSFSDDYLEFAHVEVSSDGVTFIRIPSVSLIHTDIQTTTFGNTLTEEVHNLAGKYVQGYGTPFDLEDIIDSTGINLDSVLFIRIVDVIGTIDPAYGSYDNQGALINDPYPTDFAAGGFDLDGVGVMNENNIYAGLETKRELEFSVFPNPSNGKFSIQINSNNFDLRIFDIAGNLVFSGQSTSVKNFDLALEPGIYFVEISVDGKKNTEKLVIR